MNRNVAPTVALAVLLALFVATLTRFGFGLDRLTAGIWTFNAVAVVALVQVLRGWPSR